MAEGARLESVYRGNSIQGSNPCLSAIVPDRRLKSHKCLCRSPMLINWCLVGSGKNFIEIGKLPRDRQSTLSFVASHNYRFIRFESTEREKECKSANLEAILKFQPSDSAAWA